MDRKSVLRLLKYTFAVYLSFLCHITDFFFIYLFVNSCAQEDGSSLLMCKLGLNHYLSGTTDNVFIRKKSTGRLNTFPRQIPTTSNIEL